MSSIDNRVVRMVFDNAKFKAAAQETKLSLASVMSAISKLGENRSLLNLDKDMTAVTVRAGKMQVAISTAVGTIANKLTNAGLNAVRSLTLDPIKQGFNEYESLLTKQNTIQNATGKSAKEVKQTLSELNTYSDKTIYSFGNMTDSLTKFVNAGIPLKKATVAIEGIGNAAAFAGVDANKAADASYAFSQALSAGFLGLQDFNQLDNAGIATVKFKDNLLQSAAALGNLTKVGDHYVTKKGTYVTATKGFRLALQEQFVTADALTNTLTKYADTTSALGKTAFNAATKVRTFSQFMDTTKEAIGSGFANVFTALIGGLDDATKTFTNLSNAVGGVISKFFNFATATLTTFRALGGQKQLLQAFHNILAPFGAIFTTIGKAFREAFPSTGSAAGQGLFNLASLFNKMTRPLAILAGFISALVGPLKTFFQIINIGVAFIKAGISYITAFVSGLLGLVQFKAPGTDTGLLGYIRDIAHEVGKAIDTISNLLNKGKSLTEAFGAVSLKLPHLSLPSFGGKSTVLSAFAGPSIKPNTEKSLKVLEDGFNGVSTAVDRSQKRIQAFGDFLSNVGDRVKSFFSSISGQDVAKVGNLTFLAVVGAIVFKFYKILNLFGNGNSLVGALTKTLKSVSGVFQALGNSLNQFAQAKKRESQAALIKSIAIAIAILAGSLLILSLIPADKLKSAFEGLGAAVAAMSVLIIVMTQAVRFMDGRGTQTKLVALGIALVGVGLGMLALATALRIMKGVGVAEVTKTLLTLGFVFAGLKVLGEMARKSRLNLLAASTSMVIIGGALIVLAGALIAFKAVDYKSMGKAGVALAGLSLALVALAFVPATGLLAGAIAFTAISASMVVLAGALALFKLIDYNTLGKAGTALAGVVLAMAALAFIPSAGLLAASVAIIAVGAALVLITGALVVLNKVKWESIGKLAVVLVILAAAMAGLTLIGGGLTGAVVLIALAGALMSIALSALILNKVDWSSIGKAAAILGILVLGFAAFLAVVYVGAPAIALLIGLGIVLTALALAFAVLVTALIGMSAILAVSVSALSAFAIGAAVAVGAFFQTLASEAGIIKDAVIKIIGVFLSAIAEAIPVIVHGIGKIIHSIIATFTSKSTADGIGKSSSSLWEKFQQKIAEYTPKIIAAVVKFVGKMVNYIIDHADDFARAAVRLISSLINGIASKIGDIVRAAANLIEKFIEGIGQQVQPLAEAGIQLLVDFINGLADAIRNKSGAVGSAIENLISAMADLGKAVAEGLAKGIGEAALTPVKAIGSLFGKLISKGKDVIQSKSPSKVFIRIGGFIVSGLTKGIQDNAVTAIKAVASMMGAQIAIASSYISTFIQHLDQQALAAQAKADGLAEAAKQASLIADAAAKKANATKSKADDKVAEQQKAGADKLQTQSDKASEAAALKAEKAQKAKDASDRKDEFDKADTLGKAQLKSQDAAAALDESKRQEGLAEKDRVAAAALDKQAKQAGISAAEKQKYLVEAKALRDNAAAEAKASNDALALAKKDAAEALKLQKQAGLEAAAEYQKQFDDAAAAAAKQAKFDASTDQQKSDSRKADAAALQAQSKLDLAAAKQLAFTNIEAANTLAQKALDEADTARSYMQEATDLDKSIADAAKAAADQAAQDALNAAATPTPAAGVDVSTTVDISASQAAMTAFNANADTLSAAVAAASAPPPIQFQQYNTSPEALSPAEVYRQTNNLLNYASGKLTQAAA